MTNWRSIVFRTMRCFSILFIIFFFLLKNRNGKLPERFCLSATNVSNHEKNEMKMEIDFIFRVRVFSDGKLKSTWQLSQMPQIQSDFISFSFPLSSFSIHLCFFSFFSNFICHMENVSVTFLRVFVRVNHMWTFEVLNSEHWTFEQWTPINCAQRTKLIVLMSLGR